MFLDVWRQAGRFEGRSAVATWLLSIARFKALSTRRRQTHAELDETIEATVADPTDDPEVMLEKKNRVREALTKLSPEHREIIDLVYYNEKSVEECAQILGNPCRHGEDPHVLRPEEIGGTSRAGVGALGWGGEALAETRRSLLASCAKLCDPADTARFF